MATDPSAGPTAINEYRDYARSILLENVETLNEANTWLKLIDPLLEALGWDLAHDAELEYSIPMGGSTVHVDYCLYDGGTPAMFVEAKAVDVPLEGERDQIGSYLKQQNVDWGLLTNGRVAEVFLRKIDGADVVVSHLGSVELLDDGLGWTLLEAVTKDSIRTGRGVRIAERIGAIRDAQEEIEQRQSELTELVSRTVAEEVGEQFAAAIEPTARVFLEEVHEVIGQQLDGVGGDSLWETVERETNIAYDGAGVEFPADRTGRGVFVEFVELLYGKGYFEKSDLPVQFGRKRYLLNTEPAHSDGSEMVSPVEVVEGVYLETNASIQQLETQAEQLAEWCLAESD